MVDGECTTGEDYQLLTFPVKVEAGWVYVELPDQETTEKLIGAEQPECVAPAAE